MHASRHIKTETTAARDQKPGRKPAERRQFPSPRIAPIRTAPKDVSMRNGIDISIGLIDMRGASADNVAAVNPRSLAERYVALWNEPDPDTRYPTETPSAG
jgi:hypothetical protein